MGPSSWTGSSGLGPTNWKPQEKGPWGRAVRWMGKPGKLPCSLSIRLAGCQLWVLHLQTTRGRRVSAREQLTGENNVVGASAG